jgi:serine/threonine protein kinase
MEGKVVEYINERGNKKILRIMKKLGQGGFGIVYKALLDGFGEVAVKFQTRLDTRDIKAALLEYSKAPLLEKHCIVLRRIVVSPATKSLYPLLDNPVVVVTNSDINNNKIIFVYDLAVGLELFDVVDLQEQSGIPFALDTLKQYTSQLLEGIIEIRNAGVVHRDIKPENVMLHNGNLKFIDFGMICETSGPDKCSGLRGTMLFVSPKIIMAHAKGVEPDDADWRGSDLYAIAITIMNLFGDVPFANPLKMGPESLFVRYNVRDSYQRVAAEITNILTREGYMNFAPIIIGLTSQNPITPEEALEMLKNVV